MQKFRSVWLTIEKELKIKLPFERPAAILVLFVRSTRIFLAKAVYMVLGSSYLSARKILAQGTSQRFARKLNTENI